MLIEVLAATTALGFAMVVMGQALLFDQQMLGQADQQLEQGITARNCCRFVRSLAMQKDQYECPQWFRHPNGRGDWSVRLSGGSCLVSWSYQGNHGHFTLLV